MTTTCKPGCIAKHDQSEVNTTGGYCYTAHEDLNLDVEEQTIVEFRDPLNARDYAKSLNLLCALYDWARHLNRGHASKCDCNLCKTLKETDAFLNHREVG